MSQNGVNRNQVRHLFGFVRDTYQDGRQALTNAVTQVKLTIENKAASLASAGVDKITSNAWVARQLQRFNIDPKPFNDMASNAVRKAVGFGLDKLQDAAMNTPVGRKISLIDSGIQGSLSMGSEVLGCDGTNGCAGVHGLRVLQGTGSGGGLDLYFNAEFSPDAINAAAKGAGLSYSREQIAAAVTAALADPVLVQRAINEAALESIDPTLRQDLGTCQVTRSLVTQPSFFQTPIVGWNTVMANSAASTPQSSSSSSSLGSSSGSASGSVSSAPTAAPVASSPPTQRPSTLSAYFVPCKTNCPTDKATVPQCGFYQVSGEIIHGQMDSHPHSNFSPTTDPNHSTPLHSTPLHSTPLHSTPLRSHPLPCPFPHPLSTDLRKRLLLRHRSRRAVALPDASAHKQPLRHQPARHAIAIRSPFYRSCSPARRPSAVSSQTPHARPEQGISCACRCCSSHSLAHSWPTYFPTFTV